MVILLASIIIALVTFECIFHLWANGPNKGYDWDFSEVIASLFFGCILAGFITLVTFPCTREYIFEDIEYKIVASKTDTRIEGELHGGIFYFRGKIEDVDYYFFLTKYGDNIYKQGKVRVENTVIVETQDAPKVKIHKKYVWSSLPQWIRFKHQSPEYIDENDTIFVPVGTVGNNVDFNIF